VAERGFAQGGSAGRGWRAACLSWGLCTGLKDRDRSLLELTGAILSRQRRMLRLGQKLRVVSRRHAGVSTRC
jgi:hypothetical protein